MRPSNGFCDVLLADIESHPDSPAGIAVGWILAEMHPQVVTIFLMLTGSLKVLLTGAICVYSRP